MRHHGCAQLRPVLVLAAMSLALISTLAGAADRSRVLRAEFQRHHPCQSTGLSRGACPGWQVDHREALVCGGRDELANLQWLTIEAHRQKTRVEVKLCRGRWPAGGSAGCTAGHGLARRADPGVEACGARRVSYHAPI